jgi:hypothetical protein
MRRVRYHFVVTGPDIEPVTFETRAQARDWCREHFHGSADPRGRPRHQETPAAKAEKGR